MTYIVNIRGTSGGLSLIFFGESKNRNYLISAAVTGKIDVRNWQAPEQGKNDKVNVA